MHRRAASELPASRAWLLGVCLICALIASCKEHGSSEQDTRPLPAPEPPATSAAALPRDEPSSAPKRKASDEDSDTGAKPRRPAGDEPEANPPSGAATANADAAANAPPGSGGSSAAAPSAVPPVAAPSAACVSRCQGAMQGCLSTPVDGGVPGFGNLELCKKAFEACQAACSK